ncbi:MAG TPA: nuclear transport factor 2 family protein [Gemmatimonadales bacterium]|nr:nuclear transport factor 2 family protein [Gemmatimonadales bacterium]
MNLRIVVLVAGGVVAASPASAQLTTKDTTEFLSTTQAMLDAITTGDTSVWAPHLASDWFETDEEGNRLSRSQFLAQMHPLPPGQSGVLKVGAWHLVGHADWAVLTYDIEETHHFYDQTLITRFHSTDTYARVDGRWRQVATQQSAFPTPVAGITIAPSQLASRAGTYALTSSISLSISVRDSGLWMARGTGPAQRLYALTDQLFVVHGRRGVWVFERDADGKVTALVYWRDNNGVRWRRT